MRISVCRDIVLNTPPAWSSSEHDVASTAPAMNSTPERGESLIGSPPRFTFTE